MIFALIVLVPVFFLSLWGFFSLSPRVESMRGVLSFNLSVLVVGLLVCAFLTLKVYTSMVDGPDRAWWPVLSALGSLVVFPMVLAIGGLLRNQVFFRVDRTHG